MPSKLFIRKLLVVSTWLAGTALAGLSTAQPNDRGPRDHVMPRDERMMERPRPMRGDRPGLMRRNADTNNDGLISQEEFITPRTEHYEREFDHRDRDDDGLLSREELQRRRHHPRPNVDVAALRACVAAKGGNATETSEETDRFSAADTDGDGFLSKAEFFMDLEQRAFNLFTRIDADGDGQLSTGELSSQKEDRMIQGSIVRECLKEQHNPTA